MYCMNKYSHSKAPASSKYVILSHFPVRGAKFYPDKTCPSGMLEPWAAGGELRLKNMSVPFFHSKFELIDITINFKHFKPV